MPLREQLLPEALRRQADDSIRSIEDRLHGTIVLLQLDDGRGRIKLSRKVENIAYRRAAKRIDGLSVVAHNGNGRTKLQYDFCLEHIRVLILIHEHVIESSAHLVPVAL